jgi:hypothetical protein
MRAVLILALLVAGAWFLVAASDNSARVTFQSCEEAREAGAPLPLTAADPGWNANLDPDGDGAAC